MIREIEAFYWFLATGNATQTWASWLADVLASESAGLMAGTVTVSGKQDSEVASTLTHRPDACVLND